MMRRWLPISAPPRRLARRAAIAGCLAVLLGLVVSYLLMLQAGSAGPKKSDFVPYYAVADLVLHGHGGKIYDLPAIGHLERVLVAPLHIPHGAMPFLYPPYAALLIAPLAALPYTIAYLIWFVLNLAVFVGSLLLLVRYTGLGRQDRSLFIVGALSFFPPLVALAQGQVSILVFGLLVCSFLALRSGRFYLVGPALALAVIKPPLVLPLCLVLLVRKEWKTLATAAGAGALLAAGAGLALGRHVIPAYAQTMLAAGGWQSQYGGFAPRWNFGFFGFTGLLLPRTLASPTAALLSLAVLAALVWFAWHQTPSDTVFAAAVVAGTLISPHLLIHDLTILLLPAAVAVRHINTGPARLPAILAAIYLLAVLGLPLAAVTHIQFLVPAMLLLFAWLIAVRPARPLALRPPIPATRRVQLPALEHLAEDL